MTTERWRRINELFHAAAERDPAARQQLLDETAGTDPELATEVRSLLAAHERDADFLEAPAWAAAPELLDEGEPLQPGTQLGPYTIVREVGRGGMGVVYEAEDARLQRSVALKALPAQYRGDSLRRERLTREARAAAALSHPSIATIFALEELDSALYLVSEFVRGQTLREELRAGPLPPDRLLRTLIDLASGLAAAHAAGIVHRDLKPDNVIRCADGGIKILDFGLARLPSQDALTSLHLTQTGTAVGTPGYMAPEQLSGGPVDPRSDVFALGVLGWELATGAHPFGASTAELLARMADIMNRGPSSTAAGAIRMHGLEGVLRRCLRRNPADRYSSGTQLLGEFERLRAAGTGAPAARSLPRGGRSMRWWQIHQGAIAALVASMPIAAWFVRRWGTPLASSVFLLVLALSTVAVSIRLNLLFTSRVNAPQLPAQRQRVYLPLTVTEGLLGLVLLGTAAGVSDGGDVLAAILVTLAVTTLASLGIIEPATTAAALGQEAEPGQQEGGSHGPP